MPLPISLPTWSATKSTSKAGLSKAYTTAKPGFDKIYALVDKLGPPVNRLSNKLGAEAFWPTTIDKESDKAARILRSFCKDGFYIEEEPYYGEDQNGSKVDKEEELPEGVPRGKQRVLKKIPQEVIRGAKGLAIFTTMRTGLWISGAGGSGVLVARMENGEWSPPSGIMLHTAGLGFLIGVDIYDCVVVINTEEALQAFMKIRCTLGGEVSAVAGPVGIGGVLETEVHKRQAPVWNYLKSRGFYAGVQIDGTVIIERSDENERFYGERIGVADILAGKARHPPPDIRGLINTIKAAQGDNDIDESALPSNEPTPGDYEVKDDGSGFGLPPSEDDPDPFGVHALQEEGMEVREAGTGVQVSGDAFEYRPSPTSPIYSTFQHRRHAKRDSGQVSIASTHTDRGTQTVNFDTPHVESPRDSQNHGLSRTPSGAEEKDFANASEKHEAPQEATVISRAKLVTIPKRIPPTLPPRSPYRASVPDVARPHSPNVTEHTGLGIDMAPPKSLNEKLGSVYISSAQSQDHLAPNRDGFDSVSMSGSDYSREFPVETPDQEPKAVFISMYDKEVQSLEVDETTLSSVPKPASVRETESDDFHSIPGTPPESIKPSDPVNGQPKEVNEARHEVGRDEK